MINSGVLVLALVWGLAGMVEVGMAQTTVTVSATASHAIPSTMWGQMFEDISSGDGGLYAELLQNRAFQVVTPGTEAALAGWQALNANSNITIIADPTPVSNALPNALQLIVPPGAAEVGFANTGWHSGMQISANTTYKASFYYRFQAASGFKGTLSVSLRDAGGAVLDVRRVGVEGKQTAWKRVSVVLTPGRTPVSLGNTFVVTVNGGGGSGGEKINFAMLSLFPPTYKNRENGMRVDIAQALADMKPTFFRLPGGNNLEGQNVASRWQWNNTVGPLLERPGRMGDWSYVNTDGLGLLEYFHWCEDLGMEAIMAVWAGYSIGGETVPQGQLGPYVQQAIDQINFVIGDPAKSAAAALRASLGHPKPFPLKYVEIGNEDLYASSSYPYRWNAFATALKAEFPELHFIATTNPFSPILSPAPTEYDVHVYASPTWFAQNSFYYDDFQRNGTKYFEGEYAGTSPTFFPIMQGSVGEAAFMTGLERNSDIVFAASWAPLLGDITNGQWAPNLIAFDAGGVYRSTSYYVQQLFSVNRGDEYLPSTLPDRAGTVFWSVVRKTASGEIIIKVSNTASTQTTLTFVLPFKNVASKGSLQLLAGPADASNTPTSPNTVVPVTSSIVTGKTFNFTAPAISVSVLTVKAS